MDLTTIATVAFCLVAMGLLAGTSFKVISALLAQNKALSEELLALKNPWAAQIYQQAELARRSAPEQPAGQDDMENLL